MNAPRLSLDPLSIRLIAGGDKASVRASLLLAMTEASGCAALFKELTQADYAVHLVHSGYETIMTLERRDVDIVLLHTDLPDTHVGQLCHYLRNHSRVPVMVLTEQKNELELVEIVSKGADVYLALPITFGELNARLQAMLRRAGPGAYVYRRETVRPSIYMEGRTRKLRIGGKELTLTQIEYRIMHFLVARANTPVTKEQLLEEVWGYYEADAINFIEVAIWRLRHKIEQNPSRPEYLITIRGTGYQLNVAAN